MPAISHDVQAAMALLPTPMLADAVVRLGLPVRQAPPGIKEATGQRVAGPALPVRHAGSVDVFLEVLGDAKPGDVMVIDNDGRTDEACIGDLIAIEAHNAGVAGVVIWGLHRDAAEIVELGMPVFSYGTLPFGPREARADRDQRFTAAQFGPGNLVTRTDVVVADDNGVLFLPTEALEDIVSIAESIRQTEAQQIAQLQQGVTLRQQFDFDTFLQTRSADPSHTFRQHLRERSNAVEE